MLLYVSSSLTRLRYSLTLVCQTIIRLLAQTINLNFEQFLDHQGPDPEMRNYLRFYSCQDEQTPPVNISCSSASFSEMVRLVFYYHIIPSVINLSTNVTSSSTSCKHLVFFLSCVSSKLEFA